MSTSWSRKIGSFVGGALAGPGGAIIGGIATSILGQATGIDDSIGDAIGGVVGDEAGALLGRLSAEEKQQINHDLQSAFRDAFCEAVYDIGGETCFAEAWKGSRDVPPEVVYPKSVGHHLWATKDPLADQLCESLHQIEQAVDELLPFEPPADHVAANVERYLSADSPQALAEAFFSQILAPYLTRFRVLFLEVPDFEPHLRRYLFDRLLVHLGEHLKQRPEAWRAFNRLVLEEIRLRVRALGTGQAHITGQLEQIMARLSRPLDNDAHGHGNRNGNPAIPSLTDELAQLLTAMGRVERKQNEGFDGLLDRVGEQHNELMGSLRGLMRIEESGKRTLGRVEEVAKQVERVEQKVDQVILRQQPSPPTSPAPPFTAPKPPQQFVQRPAEFDELTKRLLASGSQRTVAITTALQGGGGFGKTTLAQAICHDERIIEAFPDGVLWLTVGQSPSLVELLAVQIKFFAPTENYADINAAANRLRALLSRKRVLIVLDDVWQEYHARPFIQQDSPTCAHLITTRQQEIARWLQAEAVDVNEMQTSQAVDLLIKWLAGTKAVEGLATDEKLLEQLHQLAEYLGEWPLLLELAGAELRELVQVEHLSLNDAISELREALQQEGFTVFDREDEGQRNRAISISLSISLKRLGKWRERFMELAVFPEDTDIPHATIFKLWSQTARMGRYRAKKALRAMRDLSLFTDYDAEKQTVRLHDVIRAYLAQQQAQKLLDTSCVSTRLHSQLLSAYKLTNWANLPADEPYLWQHLAYHLREAKRDNELRALLFDFEWMDAKLHATDINALLADYDKLPDDNVTERVQRILSQASHILARNKNQLAGQLWGRLPEDERAQLTSITPPGAWLRPLYPSLLSHPALVRTLAGHTHEVKGVAVSADGRWALSASKDKTVKVWDLATGQERLSLAGHTEMVKGVAVSADGRWALSASGIEVKVWDLAAGQERKNLAGHTRGVNAVAVSADGRWALSASRDKTVKVWNLATGQEHLSLTGHTSFVEGVAVSADGRWALTAFTNKVKVWDLGTGQEFLSLAGHTREVKGVAVSADGRLGLSASHDRKVKVWDLATGQERLSLAGHTRGVNGVAVSADGRWALSASRDRTVKVWDLAILRQAGLSQSKSQSSGGQEPLSLASHTDIVTGVAVSGDGRWALSSSRDKTVKVWDLATGQEHLSLTGHTSFVKGVTVSADGRWALSASRDKTVKVWDLATGQERLSLAGHTGTVNGVAVSADGRWALSASWDKTVKVWDLATHRLAQTPARSVEPSSRGQEHLSLAGHTDWVNGVAVSADGRWVLSASYDKTVKIWDLATGQECLSLAGHTSRVTGVAVSADGRWALSASRDRTVKVWDLATGQERKTLTGHTREVSGVAVTADGRWALSASYDGTVKVWSLKDGRLLATFDTGEALKCGAMTPDGLTIVAGGRSGRVHFLRLEGLS